MYLKWKMWTQNMTSLNFKAGVSNIRLGDYIWAGKDSNLALWKGLENVKCNDFELLAVLSYVLQLFLAIKTPPALPFILHQYS